MKILAVYSLLMIFFSSFQQMPKSKVIVAVFAHPDDEGAISQLLVKYGKNNKVYIIIATDGRNGVREHAGIPAGDSLAGIRKKESECACRVLGIEPPIFLGLPDGFDTRNGVGEYLEKSNEVKQKLTRIIEELNPDIIISFGPDGDTGHADHRMASNMITEIILTNGWVEKFPLFYLGWKKKDDLKFKMIGGLNTIDSSYLNVSIKYSEEDENIAMKAFDCYKTQITPDEVRQLTQIEKRDSSNTFHFWQLGISSKQKTDF